MARLDGLNGPVDSKLGEPKESIRVQDVQGFELARQREVAMMEQATMDTIESNKQRDWLSGGAFQCSPQLNSAVSNARPMPFDG